MSHARQHRMLPPRAAGDTRVPVRPSPVGPSRALDVVATTAAAGIGATVAVTIVGGRPLLILPIALAIGVGVTLVPEQLRRLGSRSSSTSDGV